MSLAGAEWRNGKPGNHSCRSSIRTWRNLDPLESYLTLGTDSLAGHPVYQDGVERH